MSIMHLRPHHIVDIIAQYGQGQPFIANEDFGNAVHTVADVILNDHSQPLHLLAGADAICFPCRYLTEDLCTRMLETESVQALNDRLDNGILALMGCPDGTDMTVREFYQWVNGKEDAIYDIYTTNGRIVADGPAHVAAGLKKLLG